MVSGHGLTMDNITHLAVAGTLGYAMRSPGFTWRHVGVMAMAAVIPDITWIASWFAPAWYLRDYHGPTHSILGAAALAALLAFFAQRHGGVASPWLAAFLGVSTHLFLDGFTGFGEQLFWPFTDHRFGIPIVASYDGTNLVILGVLLTIPALLNAVNREIGAKRVDASLAAWIALGLLLALLPVRAIWRARADDSAHGMPVTEDPETVLVFPSAIMPWVFHAIEETPISYMVYEMNGWTAQRMPFMTRFPKPQDNNALKAARESPTGQAFLALASVPYYTVEEGSKAIQVRIRDLGFYSPGGSNRPFSVEIEVKSNNDVVAERVNF